MRNRVVLTVAFWTVLSGLKAWADPVTEAEPAAPPDVELIRPIQTQRTNPPPVVRPRSLGLARSARIARPAPPPVAPLKPAAKLDEKAAITLEFLDKQRDVELRKKTAERLEKLGY